MKNIIGAFIIAMFAVCLALPNLVHAGAAGDSAAGSFKFLLDDGETRFVEFKANELAEGQAEGDLTLSDPAVIPVNDPDNPEEKQTPGVLIRAKLDCMDTIKNTAVVGGAIYDSNVPSAIGQRVLMVIEDNGTDGAKDRLTWGIYQAPPEKPWIPVDAERDDDRGAFLTWIATDAERKDDVGIPMPPGKLVQCRTFPGASYDFPEIKYAGGDLQVTAKQ